MGMFLWQKLTNNLRVELRTPEKIGALATLPVLLLFLTGCISQKSGVATRLGFEKSVKVKAGPYQLHYGQSGTNDLVLLCEGKSNLFSRVTGQGTDIYLNGQPFIHFVQNADGSVTNLHMDVLDKDGNPRYSLIDRNADGQWDVKIDDATGKVYVWKNGGWVQH
jgi:hypothetical protein